MPQSFNQGRHRKLWNRRYYNNLDLLRHNLPKRLPDELNLSIMDYMKPPEEPTLNSAHLAPKLSEAEAGSRIITLRNNAGQITEVYDRPKVPDNGGFSPHNQNHSPHDQMSFVEQLAVRQNIGRTYDYYPDLSVPADTRQPLDLVSIKAPRVDFTLDDVVDLWHEREKRRVRQS